MRMAGSCISRQRDVGVTGNPLLVQKTLEKGEKQGIDRNDEVRAGYVGPLQSYDQGLKVKPQQQSRNQQQNKAWESPFPEKVLQLS